MGYIVIQTNHNDSLNFGPYENESISQSVFFYRPFQLNSITVLFDRITIDPATDLKFRCEVRKASGDDYLLNLDDPFLMSSPWYTDDSLISYSWKVFELNRTILDSGFYYFSFFSNERIKYPIYFALQKNANTCPGSLIKITGSCGTYYNTQSLAFKIDGVWDYLSALGNNIQTSEIYVTTTIRESS